MEPSYPESIGSFWKCELKKEDFPTFGLPVTAI